MKTVHLALKNTFFKEIQSGKKKTEYRDMDNSYLFNKFVNVGSYPGMTEADVRKGIKDGKLPIRTNGWTHIMFHCNGMTMLVEWKDIKAEGRYFAIGLGKVLTGKKKADDFNQ